jgi:hypothetical protein
MRIWSAYVAPAKNNNFICESIVKRDNGRGALCGASRLREHAYNFSAYFKVRKAHALNFSNDCLYSYAARRITETQTVYDPQRKILRMRANPACVSISA